MPELRWGLTLPFAGAARDITTLVLMLIAPPDQVPGLIDALAP